MSTGGSGSLSAPGREGNYSPVLASWERGPAPQHSPASHTSQSEDDTSPSVAWDAAPSNMWRDWKLQIQLFPLLFQPCSCCGLCKDSCP